MGRLLWAIALISLAIGPIVLLVFFQLQFLPYHHEGILWWQRIAVVLDLGLLWVLWHRIGLREAMLADDGEARRRWPRALRRIGIVLTLPLLTLLSVPLVFAVATFQGEWLERTLPPIPLRETLVAGEVDLLARKPTSWWSNRLVLPGLDVIDHTKFDSEAKIAALSETVSLRKRHLEGAVLIGAVMRKADLTGAELQGARLDEAQLQGASLNEAQFRSAQLIGTQLQGASLFHAQLQGASLFGAQLQGASLDNVQLRGASLDHAQLQGASLVGTQLQGAFFAAAQLQGTSLQGAFVWRANARDANMTDTLVSNLVIEPKKPCGDMASSRCDWAAKDLSRLKRRIEHEIPEGEFRLRVLARLEPKLDPTKPLNGEGEMTRQWVDLQRFPPIPDAYEAELVKQWRLTGCATWGAPFVLTGLVRTLTSSFSPFTRDNSRASQLAADFLKEDCAGARGLPDNAKAQLAKLRDRVPPYPEKPGAPTQPP